MPPRPDLDKLEQPSFSTDPSSNNIYSTNIWDKPIGQHNAGVIGRIALLIPPHITTNLQNTFAFLLSSSDASDPVGTTSQTLGGPYPWIPVRMLGAGGFGSVGMWRQTDQHGNVVDEIAIKEAKLPDLGTNFAETATMKAAGIAQEAVIQAGLRVKEHKSIQEIQSEHDEDQPLTQVELDPHILALRRYKFHRPLRRARFYLLFAPHGTLSDLIAAYKVFTQPLPEAFVWTLFHSLILALLNQSGALDKDSVLYQWRQRPRNSGGDYIVHCDIKPQNILLDYAEMEDDDLDHIFATESYPNDLTRLYPRVCLSDYGVAIDSGPDCDNSPPRGWGTRGYRGPEQERWAKHFANPPNHPPAKVSTAQDIWVVGKVIFDIMAGVGHTWLQDNPMAATARAEAQFRSQGEHFLPESLQDLCPQYSKSLQRLVRACLTPEAARRPTHDEILKITQRHIWENNNSFNAATAPEKDAYRLFFRDQEIHQIPLGPGPFPAYRHDKVLWDIQYRNPEQAFELPIQLWGAHRKEAVINRGRPPYPARADLRDTHISLGEPSTAGYGDLDSPGLDGPNNGHPSEGARTPFIRSMAVSPITIYETSNAGQNAGSSLENNPASPTGQVLSSASVASADEEVVHLIQQNMKELRKQLRELDPKAKLAGKGITKKHIAKEIAKAARKAVKKGALSAGGKGKGKA